MRFGLLLLSSSPCFCSFRPTASVSSPSTQVHRLDATTTGVLLYTKTPEMRDRLKKMFGTRKVEKTYVAITNGVPK